MIRKVCKDITWEDIEPSFIKNPFRPNECDCDDYDSALMRWKDGAGRRNAGVVCLHCFRVIDNVRLKNLDCDWESLPLMEHRIVRKMWKALCDHNISVSQQKLREEEDERVREGLRRRNEYQDYLLTDEWARKRDLVLKRDNYLCQCCLENRATQVHHTQYYDNHDEPLWLLKSICSGCHGRIHGVCHE